MHSNGKQRLASRLHTTAAYGRLSKLLLAFVAVATLCGTGSLLLQARSAQLWPSPSARPAGARELHLIDDISSTRDGAFSSGRGSMPMQSATAGDVQLNGVHLRQTGIQADRAATQHTRAGREQPGAAMLPKQVSTMNSIHASDAAVQEAVKARNSDAEAAAFLVSTASQPSGGNRANPQAAATSHEADSKHTHSSSSSSSSTSRDVHVDNTMIGSTAAVAAAVAPASAAGTNVSLHEPLPFKYPIWWHSPMWSGSGYGSEGINYVLSMLRSGLVAARDLYAYNHGDNWVEHVSNAQAHISS